jgi:hypothetical protein
MRFHTAGSVSGVTLISEHAPRWALVRSLTNFPFFTDTVQARRWQLPST